MIPDIAPQVPPPALWPHLLWIVPITLLLSRYPVAFALFAYCGFGTCTDGDESPDIPAVLQFLAATIVLVGLPVYLLPWANNKKVRVGVAVAAGIVVAVGGFLLALATHW